jgi:non-ribosomal peptide synthetase-like protein
MFVTAPRTLLDVYADTLARYPERLALQAPDATYSYRELWDAAGDVASTLREFGVGPGDRVGVRLPSGTAELYTAILGVLRSGAAYVPVDADDPPARARFAWIAADACAVIDGRGGPRSLRAAGGRPNAPSPADDAWVIFTSGSTGTPKGVAVSHRSATAFVLAEARLWTVEPTDRVLAGLSVAFDASCEEMWLAWANGAALVPAPRAVVRSGPDLGPWLRANEITVVSTVPTLALLLDDDALAYVRLLILGGEACPPELGWRLAAGREVWNTYGPTEATVVSTAAPIERDRPITIGHPLAGWRTAAVDADGHAVATGEIGELCIAGVGLGRYLDLGLDDVRFAPVAALGAGRAYRTGDLVRETDEGYVFAGRGDDQVKLDGRRVELGEIDALLRAAPGVTAAAAAVRPAPSGAQLLVGYVTGAVDPAVVRADLAQRLPAGLAPQIVVLDELPISTAGKTDRAALPWPVDPRNAEAPAIDGAPLTATEAWLAERFAFELGPVAIAADSDFFALGGTSVAAARLVSALRDRYPAVAVRDLYDHRRLRDLAARLDVLTAGVGPVAPPDRAPRRRWAVVQALGVPLVLAATAPMWFLTLFFINALRGQGVTLPWGLLIAAGVVLVTTPGRVALVALARRAVLRDLRPGRFPRRSWLACRVWFVDRLGEALHVQRANGTPWANVTARLLGADVAPGARLGTVPGPAALVRIGAGATVEASVELTGYWIDGDDLVVDVIEVGAGARVGTRSVLMPGTQIGAGAEIEPGSVVSTVVPPGQRWMGSPAQSVGLGGDGWPWSTAPRSPRRPLWNAMFAVGAVVLGLLPIVGALPALALIAGLSALSGQSLIANVLIFSVPVALAFVIGEAVVNALAFRAASSLIRPGLHGDDGAVAWALWFTGQINESSLHSLFPLYATVYTRAWLRLHGIAIGRRTEVSTTEGLNRLVSLGDTSFVADHPMFACAQSHRGWIAVQDIEIGSHTFVGNGALLRGGVRVGDGCLIGIESDAPSEIPDGTSWFGAPALELPRIPDAADPTRTTDPTRRLVFARGAVELVRILLPTTLAIALASSVFVAIDRAGAAGGVAAAILVTPAALVVAGVAAAAATIAVKWIAIGRYRPGQSPLWSSLVWRDEIVNSCQELLAIEWLLEAARGTPIVSAYLRAMGAQVGRDVWCDTLAITEYDVVTIGDGCAINRGACIETHLFHDRLLRIGPAWLNAHSTLGPVSAILPDARLGAGSTVGARSVVMRGETVPAGTRWHGSPLVAAV